MSSKVDYWGIQQEIAEIIRANTNNHTVVVEQEIQFSPEMSPYVCVYCTGRTLAPNQVLAAGRIVTFHVEYTIWLWTYNLQIAQAMRDRDEAIGEIELILMGNRTINDLVETSWIKGGRLPSSKLPNALDPGVGGGFIAGGEIQLTVVARATINN